ncbi:sensor histidine kinase [Portibacter lacus]|uniref:Signal transduction histidine kinase internal region domain-containing protein n=1 Tax=Portibacter lacus TaxID=1099794 RepID=A0AA37SMP0_9BACT|nr:histidine kinase [Portibacter lacus]GLR16114.1 hypothetical protein GCM10007940_07290 [Portibacter lacus]
MNLLKIGLGILLGISVYVFLNIDAENDPLEMMMCAVLGIMIAYLSGWVSLKLDRYISWRNNVGLRMLVGIITLALLPSLMCIVFLNVFGQTVTSIHIKLLIIMLCLSIFFNIIYFIFYSYYEYNKGQLEHQVLQRKQTTLQLAALKSQLSPHFLFNSMNALSALFHKDVEEAEKFIRSLAKSFDYVLKRYDSPLVNVDTELKFVDSYVEMMKIRFGKHLQLITTVGEEALKSKIPPLTLQMLLENAVKHNLMNAENELVVSIKDQNDHLQISNKKNLKESVRHSTKVGLQNIAERYELISEQAIRVESNGDFTVYLPLIK